MFTLTVKIAAAGAKIKDESPSVAGHMWLSVYGNGKTSSMGFGPVKQGDPFGPGEQKYQDDSKYLDIYYSGKIYITEDQYHILKDFSKDPKKYGFDIDKYNGVANSCIDFTWKALHTIGLNSTDFEGNLLPSDNADNVDKSLYKYVMGNGIGWQNTASKGNYHVTYENNENNTVQNDGLINTIFGLGGDDNIKINGNKDSIIVGGAGNDTLVGGDGADYIYAGNQPIIPLTADSTNVDQRSFNTLTGGKGRDFLIGGVGDDILIGDDDNERDALVGGKGKDTYHAGNLDIIKDDDGKGEVYFKGDLLKGGIYNKEEKAYISEDKKFQYKFIGSLLSVKNQQTNDTIIIERYFKEEKSLGINLTDKAGKEVSIVIDTTGSMYDDIDTAKASARAIASNIFKENTYSKISIVTFSDNNIKTVGVYTDYESFQQGINSVREEGGGIEYHNAAIIEGMRNFTKDNGLSKEIYLMTDEPGDDNERTQEVIDMAKNFGTSILRSINAKSNSEHFDNSVKINVISINSDLQNLKIYAQETGGKFFQPNSLGELEDALFDLSNTGTNQNEIIKGNDKDNIIDGKGGDDILEGDKGSDTYIFDANFGKDVIVETNTENKDKNSIDMSKFSIKEVVFRQKNNDVVIHKSKTDTVTIKDFYGTEEKISLIKFKDTLLDHKAIKEFTALQTNKAVIKFAEKGETKLKTLFDKVYFKADDDTPTLIEGGVRSDALIGSNLNDKIYGHIGHDTLIGGKGDDYLNGGIGNDTYIFTKGDGKDIIKDTGGRDTLLLRNINRDELVFSKSKNDLIMRFKNQTDEITVKDHFKWAFGYHSKLENIKFEDDTQIGHQDILDMLVSLSGVNTYESHVDIEQ